MSTAVWPLQQAMYTAFTGDATLAARLAGDKVYDEGTVPEGAVPAYLVFGTSHEGDFHTFGRDGNEGAPILHLWAAKKSDLLAIYGDVQRIVAGLSVSGHTLALLTTRLVSTMRDPSGLMHGVVAVRALTQAGA